MAPMLRARLFGGLAVEVNGRVVADLPGMKPRALLAYLLTRPGLQSRARVAGVFWPDVLDTSARASLRSALWSVRGALEAAGGGAYLVSDRASAGLAPDLPRWIDAEEAERLLAAGDRGSLERAVELAARPFLPEIADEWAIEAQDAWRERLVGALDRLAELAEAEGDMVAAIEWTRRALRHDRLREAGHRALIRRLADAGERAQAMGAYRRCRDVMAAELGIPPSAETRALAEGLRSAPAPPAAPPGAAPAPPPAAPAPPAPPRRPPLRGREAELETLRGALAAAAAGRGGVAAIEGAAGIGKSRLAAELMALAAAAGARDRVRRGPRPRRRAALRGLVRGPARARPRDPAPARRFPLARRSGPALPRGRVGAGARRPWPPRPPTSSGCGSSRPSSRRSPGRRRGRRRSSCWRTCTAPTRPPRAARPRRPPLGDLPCAGRRPRRRVVGRDVDAALEAVRRQDARWREVALGPLAAGRHRLVVGDAAPGLSGEEPPAVALAAEATRSSRGRRRAPRPPACRAEKGLAGRSARRSPG